MVRRPKDNTEKKDYLSHLAAISLILCVSLLTLSHTPMEKANKILDLCYSSLPFVGTTFSRLIWFIWAWLFLVYSVGQSLIILPIFLHTKLRGRAFWMVQIENPHNISRFFKKTSSYNYVKFYPLIFISFYF